MCVSVSARFSVSVLDGRVGASLSARVSVSVKVRVRVSVCVC